MKTLNQKIREIVNLDKKIEKLPTLSSAEQQLLEADQRFEATFYSNKLEGNKLSKDEARAAVLSD